MIDEVFTLLQERLNSALLAGSDSGTGGSGEDRVVFPEGGHLRESVEFKVGAVTALLVGLEEETALRPADRYERMGADGVRQRASPDIRLNLQILFVSHFQQYTDSLRHLSGIIRYFQTHRVIHQGNTPELSERIDQLILELVTPTFGEWNEIWGALRTSPRPCALYRVRMIVFRDQVPRPISTIESTELRIEA